MTVLLLFCVKLLVDIVKTAMIANQSIYIFDFSKALLQICIEF